MVVRLWMHKYTALCLTFLYFPKRHLQQHRFLALRSAPSVCWPQHKDPPLLLPPAFLGVKPEVLPAVTEHVNRAEQRNQLLTDFSPEKCQLPGDRSVWSKSLLVSEVGRDITTHSPGKGPQGAPQLC